jgi:putative tryptophan/tyrosine transport system substrate-binding protein
MPITRRALLAALLGVVTTPAAVRAQRPARIPRIGVIGERSGTDQFLATFGQGLRDLGYVEGQTIHIEYRYAEGASDRFPRLAAELVRLDVDVLVVGGTVAAQAAKAQTTTVPIVFALAGDPVASGLVSSLARPGGNATGMSSLVPELSAKQLELLKAAAPQISRVTVLYNPDNQAHAGPTLDEAREAARALGLDLQALEVRHRGELAGAFAALTGWRAGAVLALGDPVIGIDLVPLAQLAARHRLPAMYSRREFAVAGGLLTYGPRSTENYRRVASYVDRILKGAKPADLPVERPTTFEFVINLKTARALGLTISPALLGRADEVLQ